MAETEAQRILREKGGGAAPEGSPGTAMVRAQPTRIEQVRCKDPLEAYQKLQSFIDSGEYNVVLPSEVVDSVSPYFATTLAIVRLDPSAGAGMVYGHPTADRNKPVDFLKPNERALAKNGLMTLADAAGIIWDMNMCKRLDNGSRPGYCSFQAVGGIRKSDGTMTWLKKTRDSDMEVEQQARNKVNRQTGEITEYGVVSGSERRFQATMTETKAYLAVVRMMLKLKQKYTETELAKAFVLPRMVFTPNYDDPQVRVWMMQLGANATAQLYGPQHGQAALPASTVAEAEAGVAAMQGEQTTTTVQPGDTVVEDSGKPDVEEADVTIEPMEELGKAPPEPKAEVAKPVEKPAKPQPSAEELDAVQKGWLDQLAAATDLAALRGLGTSANKDKERLGPDRWAQVVTDYKARETAMMLAARAAP